LKLKLLHGKPTTLAGITLKYRPHIQKPKRAINKRTENILAKGREDSQKKGIKAFAKRWTIWVKGTGILEDEIDEILVISSDTPIKL
jgi:hypothetical protein